jgi:GNAT superfamily N-acetyltransferase
MSRFVVRTRADCPDLKKAASAIEQAAWNDLGYLNYTRPHYEMYARLLETYADYQLCLVDEERGYPVAVANCVPLSCRGVEGLPPEGWDWVVETAATRGADEEADTLGALAISVPAIYREKGYARLMIRELLALAERKGLKGLVAPVRPSLKARHPFVAIEDYVTWTDDRGRPYDPWIRSHLASGGRLVGPCVRSMVVEEPVGFWENWTEQRFERSGSYEVAGGLVPLEIDLERQRGRYAEPNVWVAYTVGSA